MKNGEYNFIEFNFSVINIFNNKLLVNYDNIHIDKKNIYLNYNFKNKINYASCQCESIFDYAYSSKKANILNINCPRIPWIDEKKTYHLILDLFHNDIEFNCKNILEEIPILNLDMLESSEDESSDDYF